MNLRTLCRLASLALLCVVSVARAAPPNIVWIVGEDASAHLSCYGETTIRTPNLDAMANSGIRFDNAFVTCPVCSPSRSAMVTGMYQTTLGTHNHRSQNDSPKAGGNTAYYDSYRLPVKTIPELFREAGYHTSNGTWSADPSKRKPGKTDYNFMTEAKLYDGADWNGRKEGQPFFAQIQLKGGKNRRAKQHATDPTKVTLPPYYPDHPVLREDWADYLNSWVQMDVEVGQILAALESETEDVDNTIVFFWTDHGVSHLRGKQFLYDEGIRVPLIVRFPGGDAGSIREDLVTHLDIAASSLAAARIDIPDRVQGHNLFAQDYKPQRMIFAARDRCDETIDVIRSVRTPRYKYIRNFMSYRPHALPNVYKDGKQIIKTIRGLHAEGELGELTEKLFRAPRPTEELYDLQADPFETENLAGDPAQKELVADLRNALYDWMVETGDLGLIPEPILEEMGRKYGNKSKVLAGHPETTGLIRHLISVIEAGERGEVSPVENTMDTGQAAARYWCATWLGWIAELGGEAEQKLREGTEDISPAVRVASALALCKLGLVEEFLPLLAKHVEDENLIVGLYALHALEELGEQAAPARDVVEAAKESPYEFSRRVAKRFSATLAGSEK